jgi:predicted kinase
MNAIHGPTVIVISGSIASGKSTLAQAVAAELASAGRRCAVIDIDVLHDMLSDGLDPAWAIARQAAGPLTDSFLAAGVQVVVMDGEFITAAERASYLEKVRAPVTVQFVTLRVRYDEALQRAQGDPARGVSRDPAFLETHYATVQAALDATPGTDLVIHTDEVSVPEAAKIIVAFVAGG